MTRNQEACRVCLIAEVCYLHRINCCIQYQATLTLRDSVGSAKCGWAVAVSSLRFSGHTTQQHPTTNSVVSSIELPRNIHPIGGEEKFQALRNAVPNPLELMNPLPPGAASNITRNISSTTSIKKNARRPYFRSHLSVSSFSNTCLYPFWQSFQRWISSAHSCRCTEGVFDS